MRASAHEYQAALVTGASSGIGAGFAKILAPTTRLLLTGRDEPRLRQLTAELNGAAAGGATYIAADLASAEGRAALVQRALETNIDLLVCNAGAGWSGNFLDSPLSQAHDTVAVNILAALELLHALLPAMIDRARSQQRRAAAIIVTSTAAFAQAPAGLACYAASKAFELHLAEALAQECRGDPLDVLALCPTYTATAFFARAGLPPPAKAMAPEDVAREALAALGRRSVHLCSMHRYPQVIRQLAAFNPALLEAWRLPRRIIARLLPQSDRSS